MTLPLIAGAVLPRTNMCRRHAPLWRIDRQVVLEDKDWSDTLDTVRADEHPMAIKLHASAVH